MPSRPAQFVAAALLSLMISTGVHAQDRLLNSQLVQSISQWDLNNILIPNVLSQMTPTERQKAQRVKVRVVLDQAIGRVRAFETSSGSPRIEISTGFLSLIGHLIDANLVAHQFEKLQQIRSYKQDIADFMRTYRQVIRNGGTPEPPPPFAEYAGISEDVYAKFSRSRAYKGQFSTAMRSVLSIVLTHEYAHHIFDHVKILPSACSSNRHSDKCLEARRAQEDEADDFSIRVNWMLGVNPLIFTDYFLVFALVEDSLLPAEHAPSVCRLEKFLDAGLAFSKADQNFWASVQNSERLSAYVKQMNEAQEIFVTECEAGGLMTKTTIPGLFE